ncbi:retrovirus-related pol polyprotein from transposon TNT 1-94 [Tanacetum coccineum]
MADQRTTAELLRAPTEGYAEAIVVPPIPAEHFNLKHSLINLVTSKQFFGFEKEDPHAHIRYFNKITSTLKYKDVPETSIKLMLFPFSIDELTLRVDDKAITFKVGQTSRYFYNDDVSINRIDVIDAACEEYAQEVLGFSDSSTSGNPTPSLDPILSTSSPSLTPFEEGDFILEEIEACLTNDSIPSGIDDEDFDPEGDLLLLEKLLNDDPSSPLCMICNQTSKMAEQDTPPPTITAMKIPIIKKGEYDIWSMRMRQYICHTDHNLWDVIVNGDLEEEAAPSGEQSAPPAPKTAKQLAAKRNQERVKSILLLAIPDEYLLKFHNVPDAKSLWAAIKSRFGGNEESKKMQKNVLKHQFENFTTASNESLDKAYDRFQKLISQLEVHGAPELAFLSSENKAALMKLVLPVEIWSYTMEETIHASQSSSIQQIVKMTWIELDIRIGSVAIQKLSTTTVTGKGTLLRNANQEGTKGKDLIVIMAGGIQQQMNHHHKHCSSSSSDNEVQTYSKQCLESLKLFNEFIVEREKHSRARLEIQGYELALESLESRILGHEKNELAWGEKYEFQNYELNQMSAKDKNGLGYGTQLDEMSYKSETDSEISLSVFLGKTNEVNIEKHKSVHKSVVSKPKINRDKIIIEDWNSDDEDDVSEVNTVSPIKTNETQTVKTQVDKIGQISQKEGIGFKKIKACFVCKSTDHLKKDCDFYAKKSPEPKLKTVVNTGQRVVKPVWDNAKRGNLEICLQDHAVVDSGCSSPMTGNKVYLSDYEDYNEGFVAFGSDPKGGKITSKGKIKTANLDFDDVYFVDELKFNLFSVSQMRDKKNSVLFTDTECLILSPSFKLLDENQVVLRAPKQNDVYSLDLKNIIPFGERKNRTLIEAVRTMLADSLFTFPLGPDGSKPHSISFMDRSRCPLTILNTLDPLGKFDGKSDEGYLLGYSTTSKAFRVYNKRTKRVEENMHIDFLEDQPNVAGSGPDWMFDLDFLTNTMNYIPVSVENQVNVDACTQEHYVAGSSENDKEPTQEYILLPLHPHRPRILVEDVVQVAQEKPSKNSPKDNDVHDSEDAAEKEEQHTLTEAEQVLKDDLDRMIAQEIAAKAIDDATRQAFKEEKKRAAQATSINKLNTGRPFVSTSNSPLVSTANTPYASAASTPTNANTGGSSFVYLGG